jgi:hypothetical protein
MSRHMSERCTEANLNGVNVSYLTLNNLDTQLGLRLV